MHAASSTAAIPSTAVQLRRMLARLTERTTGRAVLVCWPKLRALARR